MAYRCCGFGNLRKLCTTVVRIERTDMVLLTFEDRHRPSFVQHKKPCCCKHLSKKQIQADCSQAQTKSEERISFVADKFLNISFGEKKFIKGIEQHEGPKSRLIRLVS